MISITYIECLFQLLFHMFVPYSIFFILIFQSDVIIPNTGDLKRIYATGESVAVKRLFVELDDITSVTCKAHDNDVVITLKNGCEYLLDELNDPKEIYGQICRYIAEDEYD